MLGAVALSPQPGSSSDTRETARPSLDGCELCGELVVDVRAVTQGEGTEPVALCRACIAVSLARRRPRFREFAVSVFWAVLAGWLVSTVLGLVTVVGAGSRPPSVASQLTAGWRVIGSTAPGTADAVGLVAAVAALAVAVAVSLERSSEQGELLAARARAVPRGAPLDLSLEGRLLRLEDVATLQYFVVLALAGFTGALTIVLARRGGPSGAVSVVAALLVAWMLVESVRLRSVVKIAENTRQYVHEGDRELLARRRRDVIRGGTAWQAWAWILATLAVSALTGAVATCGATGCTVDSVSTGVALFVGGAVAAVALVLAAALTLVVASRAMGVTYVVMLVLVWVLSLAGTVVDAAAGNGATSPFGAVFLVASASVWVLLALGVCGLGPARAAARVVTGPADAINAFDDWWRARAARRGKDPAAHRRA